MSAPADDYATWPDTLVRLAKVIGRDATLQLANTVGGLDRVFIPRTTTTSHMWSRVLTAEQWAAVVAAFGGERIDLPRGSHICLAKVEIFRLAEEGKLSYREIALAVHCTERHVRRILSGMNIPKAPDTRQTRLFDD